MRCVRTRDFTVFIVNFSDLAIQYKSFTSLPELSGREKVLEVGSNKSTTLAGSLVGRRVVWLYNSPI